ncbi:MAG: hypothetical protein K2V38_29765 [Gemmataceae bacterium]|nr:hypothetical protein [Gemmataceae bacterium]
MTAEVYANAAPNSVAFVMAHLLPLAPGPNRYDYVAANRWAAGMPLPYRAVERVDGDTDIVADYPAIKVHTFAKTYTEASNEADRTHQRMLILLDDPLYDVVMPGGRIANCNSLTVLRGPEESEYPASSVVKRFVAEYLPVLRLAPTS